MLCEFGFDNKEVELWSEPIEIPLGVSMTPFVIHEVILSGLHFQDIEEYPEISYECKKEQIPKWYLKRFNLLILKELYLEQELLLDPIQTIYQIVLISSVNNEFGPGLYCTPNFNLAVEYAGKNSAILVYNWSNLDGDFTIKT
ncbi:hypothetical protein RhiirA5_441175 [Rhizophagus irregularis]|uniref:Uncharacterized protein n=1 Tax=Rhizophagus irregularis TaxID=588596 RepID=A0A2N0NFW9_9GLOM|nr:hypothetical protein RhiirA5_441175 [Rhizophagus irregularis]